MRSVVCVYGNPDLIDRRKTSLAVNALDMATLFILIDVSSCKGWGYSEETLQGRRK
jgi:hypothetical protein